MKRSRHWLAWVVLTFVGGITPLLIRYAVYFMFGSAQTSGYLIKEVGFLGMILNLAIVYELLRDTKVEYNARTIFGLTSGLLMVLLVILVSCLMFYEYNENAMKEAVHKLYIARIWSLGFMFMSLALSITAVITFNKK